MSCNAFTPVVPALELVQKAFDGAADGLGAQRGEELEGVLCPGDLRQGGTLE